MKLIVEKLPQTKYSVGDIVIREHMDSDPVLLNMGTKNHTDYYYGSFLSGHGQIGSGNPDDVYYYSTMDELIKAIEEHGKIIQHYSKSHYALKIVPIGGE